MKLVIRKKIASSFRLREEPSLSNRNGPICYVDIGDIALIEKINESFYWCLPLKKGVAGYVGTNGSIDSTKIISSHWKEVQL